MIYCKSRARDTCVTPTLKGYMCHTYSYIVIYSCKNNVIPIRSFHLDTLSRKIASQAFN